jgi:hypothetical protein
MSSIFYCAGSFAFALPFLAIAAILFHNGLRNRRRRRSKNLRMASAGYCSSWAALGTMLLFAQAFYRPSMEYVAEAKLEVDVDEDDSGDPESTARQLSRQLRKIRLGEPVDHLILRL